VFILVSRDEMLVRRGRDHYTAYLTRPQTQWSTFEEQRLMKQRRKWINRQPAVQIVSIDATGYSPYATNHGATPARRRVLSEALA
jgi:hypothetical protein